MEEAGSHVELVVAGLLFAVAALVPGMPQVALDPDLVLHVLAGGVRARAIVSPPIQWPPPPSRGDWACRGAWSRSSSLEETRLLS
jgi:hypothetical protein